MTSPTPETGNGNGKHRLMPSSPTAALLYLVDRFGPTTVALAVALWWGAENVAKPVISRHLEFLDQEVALRKVDTDLRRDELAAREKMLQVLTTIHTSNEAMVKEQERQGNALTELLKRDTRSNGSE